MGNVRLGITAALLLAPLSACALLLDTDSLEGSGAKSDSGASTDGATNGDGNGANGDAAQGDAFVPVDGIVHLATKNIYGPPGGPFVIKFDGGPLATNLSLGFRSSANNVSYASTVGAGGQIILPPTAGVYRVELRDAVSGLVSYGQATVTHPVASFSSIGALGLPAFSPFGSIWPQTTMMAGDITGDAHPDLVIASGYAAADNSVSNAGFYPYHWDTGMDVLAVATPISLPGKMICGAALMDIDDDADNDIVFVANDMASYTFSVCSMNNSGSGVFSAPSCVTDVGTASNMFRCVGGMAVADFDRDGRADLAVAGGMIDVQAGNTTSTKDVRFYRNTAGGFVANGTLTTPSNTPFTSIAIGDLNDDGKLDVIANGGSPAAVHMFVATGDFSFSPAQQIAGDQTDPSGTFYSDQVTLGYLNDDTAEDILLSHTNGPSSVFFSGTAGYALSTIPNFAEQHCSRFEVLDLNIDGVPDIILPYKNRLLANNTFGALWSNANSITTGAAPSTTNSIFGSTTTPSWVEGSMIFADWNSDGKIDALDFATYVMQIEALIGH